MPEYTDAEINSALEGCAREPVHIPGAIQPNGCLVSTDLTLERVLQVSANVEAVLGVPLSEALAGPPDQLIGPELVQRLRSMGVEDSTSFVSDTLVRRSVNGIEQRFSARHYRSGSRVVIELELQEPGPGVFQGSWH